MSARVERISVARYLEFLRNGQYYAFGIEVEFLPCMRESDALCVLDRMRCTEYLVTHIFLQNPMVILEQSLAATLVSVNLLSVSSQLKT